MTGLKATGCVAEREEQMRGIEEFLKEEDGIGVVEIILILVVIFTIYMGCK